MAAFLASDIPPPSDTISSIATTATLNLDARTGDAVELTGTTTVTAVTLAEGDEVVARSNDAFQITVGASLIGNQTGNVAVAAGDRIFFRGYAAGVVRFWVIRKSGKPMTGPAAADISDSTAAGRNMLTAANVAAQQALLSHVPQVNVYTSSDTWTKQAGCTHVKVEIIGAGGGGGSGRKGAAGGARNGGAGGAGGAYLVFEFLASALGSTETVTIGAGGTGGASVTASDTSGNNGNAGGTTSFGAHAVVPGGLGGEGGTASAIVTTPQAIGASVIAGSGATFSAAGGAGTAGNGSAVLRIAYGASGGASGSGISAANAANAGGVGGAGAYNNPAGAPTAGTAGAVDTSGGNGAGVTAGTVYGGASGGGGGSSTTTNAGNGGAGGIYGGGGAGGGAAVNAVGNSGAGGNGAAGIMRVTSYFD